MRLDIWHFMRRLARGCTTESHPLYGTFMSQLSSCVYEWEERDVDLLMDAKKHELMAAGVPNPSTSAITKAVSRAELARHCRRQTNGTQETLANIENLLLSLSTATDTLGVPLFKEEMSEIWKEQKHHVSCLQDPPNLALYTITGYVTKGNVRIPTLRCARGSTSLESFHLHIARFIPGTSASDLHYQAYLMEGLARWNQARAAAAIDSAQKGLHSFDHRLMQKVCLFCLCVLPLCMYQFMQQFDTASSPLQINNLSSAILGKDTIPSYQPPAEYTGEKFGVEYLYTQLGATMEVTDTNIDGGVEIVELDEGFGDGDEEITIGDDVAVTTPSELHAHEDEDEVGTYRCVHVSYIRTYNTCNTFINVLSNHRSIVFPAPAPVLLPTPETAPVLFPPTPQLLPQVTSVLFPLPPEAEPAAIAAAPSPVLLATALSPVLVLAPSPSPVLLPPAPAEKNPWTLGGFPAGTMWTSWQGVLSSSEVCV